MYQKRPRETRAVFPAKDSSASGKGLAIIVASSTPKVPGQEVETNRREGEPDGDDRPGRNPARGFPLFRERLRANSALREQGWRDQSAHGKNAQRHDDEVVQVSEDGDEIGNEIDRTEGVGDDAAGEQLGVPRRAGIFAGQVEGERFSPDLLRPLHPSGKS